MQRAQRKIEHIKYALELADGPASTHLGELRFLSNCLPNINLADIDLSAEIYGKRLSLPFFIDAVTGGTGAVKNVNRKLASVARELGIAIAVGSQYGAVKSGEEDESYSVVREVYPDGLVFANISALATPEEAERAVGMISADALEIHLNPAQELNMPEGDRDFFGLLRNMVHIRKSSGVPLIVKETGCGIALEQVQRLREEGFTCFNCAGAGGTNFPAIEALRSRANLSGDFLEWGHPTCWSLIDCGQCLDAGDLLFASGGIRTAGDAARAFALGADLVGITGIVLKLVLEKNEQAAVEYFRGIGEELKKYLLLTGCKDHSQLRGVPLFITGRTYEYINCRGYDLVKICRGRRI